MTHRPLYCLLLLAYVLASLFVPALASASTGPFTETRVRDLDLGNPASAQVSRSVALGTHQGYGLAYDQIASDSLLANRGFARPHGGARHNQVIDDQIERLRMDDSVTNIRKNQVQVDVNANREGNNHPDIQYDKDGVHHNIEYDTDPRKSEMHRLAIEQNDSSARNEFHVFRK
jgi:hypothetical protein